MHDKEGGALSRRHLVGGVGVGGRSYPLFGSGSAGLGYRICRFGVSCLRHPAKHGGGATAASASSVSCGLNPLRQTGKSAGLAAAFRNQSACGLVFGFITRDGSSSIKMYDKYGCVLRIETTINDVSFFRRARSAAG